MRLVTKKQIIKEGIQNYRETYIEEADLDSYLGRNVREKFLKLSKLDLDTVTEDQINNIIGNNTWTFLACNECGCEKVQSVVRIMEKPKYKGLHIDLCHDCVLKAYMFLPVKDVTVDDILKLATDTIENAHLLQTYLTLNDQFVDGWEQGLRKIIEFIERNKKRK